MKIIKKSKKEKTNNENNTIGQFFFLFQIFLLIAVMIIGFVVWYSKKIDVVTVPVITETQNMSQNINTGNNIKCNNNGDDDTTIEEDLSRMEVEWKIDKQIASIIKSKGQGGLVKKGEECYLTKLQTNLLWADKPIFFLRYVVTTDSGNTYFYHNNGYIGVKDLDACGYYHIKGVYFLDININYTGGQFKVSIIDAFPFFLEGTPYQYGGFILQNYNQDQLKKVGKCIKKLNDNLKKGDNNLTDVLKEINNCIKEVNGKIGNRNKVDISLSN